MFPPCCHGVQGLLPPALRAENAGCAHVPHSVSPLFSPWTLEVFPVLVLVTRAAMTVAAQVALEDPAFRFWGVYLVELSVIR